MIAAAAFSRDPGLHRPSTTSTVVPPDPLRVRGHRRRPASPAPGLGAGPGCGGSSTGSARRRPEAPAAAGAVRSSPSCPNRCPAAVTAGDGGLEVVDLTVRFGGLRGGRRPEPRGAARPDHRADRAERRREDHDVQRLRRPRAPDDAGRVLLHGDDVTRAGAAARARHGLGRTFQRVAAVRLAHGRARTSRSGARRRWPAATCSRQLVGRARATARSSATSADARDGAHRHRPRCASVRRRCSPTGERRLVELARGLAGLVRRAPARRAVVGPRPHGDRALRRGAAARRGRARHRHSCSSSTTWRS